MTRSLRPIWLSSLLLANGLPLRAEPVSLNQIAAIRSLSREDAKQGFPVEVRGVVTWGGSSWFILQDETGGLTVNLGLARRSGVWRGGTNTLTLHVGEEVQIVGVCHAAGFAPDILPKTIRVLGKQPLPPARPMEPARFFSGADACERIEARGVVQGFQDDQSGNVVLQVDANPGRFTVETTRTVVKTPKELVDAEVFFRGVAGTYFNSRREVTGIRLLVSQPEDLRIEKPAARSALEAAKLVLSQLWPFRPVPLGPHRQLVEGTVIYAQSGQVFYIQDGETSVRVETLGLENLLPGDRVQVSGFVDMRRQVAGLTGAVIRKIGAASEPEPVKMNPGEILALNAKAMLSGQASEPNDFDGRLITFRGRLLNIQPAIDRKPPWQRLALDASGTIVEVLLYKGDTKAFEELQPGSELEVTGIAQLEFDLFPEKQSTLQHPPSGLQLLLRSKDDVVVLQAPPWWTPQRLAGALAGGVFLLMGVMVWTWQLHRQLARKTKLLAAEMHARRDAAIEFKATLRERNRLAVNLHDTLLQTMSGLGYQLEACETEAVPANERKGNHLETARRMVQHAQEDLRGTVWALRVLPLHERTFAEALQVLANQMAEGRAEKITIKAEGALPLLSEFVAGNLLMVAQEAMHNALKHAQATLIETTVSAAPDEKHITIEIRDNGIGFDPAASSRASSGHFGLMGMRERLDRLGGKLHIESKPGRGTRVLVEVTLRPFDDELADV
ncbi:MAG: sensor histidine kinase [Verrucomicrobiota bacterium]